jgi:hypothetical protein
MRKVRKEQRPAVERSDGATPQYDSRYLNPRYRACSVACGRRQRRRAGGDKKRERLSGGLTRILILCGRISPTAGGMGILCSFPDKGASAEIRSLFAGAGFPVRWHNFPVR